MALESSPASDTAPDTPWAWRAIVGAMVGISLVGRQFCGYSIGREILLTQMLRFAGFSTISTFSWKLSGSSY